VLLLVLWELAAANGILKETVMPRPSKIGQVLWKLILNGSLAKDIEISLLRALAGYVVGALAGIVLGIGIGLFPKIKRLLNLLFEILRPIPIIAWVPVLIMWVGIDEKSKIIVIASGNALMGVIGAEMFAASSGLGYMVTYAREMSQPAKMLGGVFVIGVLGCILNHLLSRLERYQTQR
jgi:sulfonate transport system permease protein